MRASKMMAKRNTERYEQFGGSVITVGGYKELVKLA